MVLRDPLRPLIIRVPYVSIHEKTLTFAKVRDILKGSGEGLERQRRPKTAEVDRRRLKGTEEVPEGPSIISYPLKIIGQVP